MSSDGKEPPMNSDTNPDPKCGCSGGGRLKRGRKSARKSAKKGAMKGAKKGGNMIYKSLSKTGKTLRSGVSAVGTGVKNFTSRIGRFFTRGTAKKSSKKSSKK